jgi:CSLREA domain-containing protein
LDPRLVAIRPYQRRWDPNTFRNVIHFPVDLRLSTSHPVLLALVFSFLVACTGTESETSTPAGASGHSYEVTTTADAVDADPGDGECVTAAGDCSLRAAFQEANAHSGATVINTPAGTYLLALRPMGIRDHAGGSLVVDAEIVVFGAGAVDTVIDAQGIDRVFLIERGGHLVLSDVTIRGGSSDEGSGILNLGELEAERVVIAENETEFGFGAGIHSTGSLVMRDSTVSANRTRGDGGGLGNFCGKAELTNVTFSGNAANVGSSILNSDGSGNCPQTSLRLINVTLADNRGWLEGVLGTAIHSRARLTVGNTLFADTAGNNCYGDVHRIESLGGNLDSGRSCGLSGPGDQSEADPGLLPLGDYGGPTLAHALRPRSDALEAGLPELCPEADQRGTARPVEAPCAVGAVETTPGGPAEPTPFAARVLIEASRDGGAWWAPQLSDFDPMLPHRGFDFAEYLRGFGHTVDELVLGAVVARSLLDRYDLVVRPGEAAVASVYQADELAAYLSYVDAGGKLLLMSEGQPPGREDELGAAFGLKFIGTSRGKGEMDLLLDHPLTIGIPYQPYLEGAALFDQPAHTQLLGWAAPGTFIDLNDSGFQDEDERSSVPVYGYFQMGDGVVVFLGDTDAVQIVGPVVERLFTHPSSPLFQLRGD